MILVVNGHTGKDARQPLTDLGEFLWFEIKFVLWQHPFINHSIFSLDRFPGFIRRAILGCRLRQVVHFLSNSHCMSKLFLCESDTTEDSVHIMEQAWDALLSNTLVQVKEENIKQDSILPAINRTYSELFLVTSPVHRRSLISCLSKLFVLHFQCAQQPPLKTLLVFSATRIIRTLKAETSRCILARYPKICKPMFESR